MADIRINSLPSTATSFNTDDYIAIDGASGGTRRMLAANPPFSDVTLGTSGPSVKSSLSARAPRQGLVFDGSLAEATFTIPAFGTSPYTVQLVARQTSAATQRVFWAAANGAFIVYVGSNGSINWGISGSATVATSAGVFAAGVNQDVVITRVSTAANDFKIYVNGVVVYTGTDANNYTTASNSLSDSTADAFSGTLLGRVYNRALSASEVVALYEAGAPAGSDYNSASNTAINTSAFTNDGTFGLSYSTFSGASATGFTAAQATATAGMAEMKPNLSAKVGKRYRVSFTATLTSGQAPTFQTQDASGNLCFPQVTVTNGANSFEVTMNSFASGTLVTSFYTSNVTSYAISSFSMVPLGLLLAPDAAQAGGGLVWYDTSGNAANITLPASGVSWNVPTSFSTAGGWTYGSTTPPTLQIANTTSGLANTQTAANNVVLGTLKFGHPSDGQSDKFPSIVGRFDPTDASFARATQLEFYTSTAAGNALGMTLNKTGNLLIGTPTDSGNGRIQLATHTTSAGGIGFGTDTSLYRGASGIGTLELSASSGTVSIFKVALAGTAKAQFGIAAGATYIDYDGSLVVRNGIGGTTALTLTSAQQVQVNATTASTSTTTGALVVSGGVGVGGNITANNIIAAKPAGGWAQLEAQAPAANTSAAVDFVPAGTVSYSNPTWFVGHRFSAQGPLSFWAYNGSGHENNALSLTTAGNATFAGTVTANGNTIVSGNGNNSAQLRVDGVSSGYSIMTWSWDASYKWHAGMTTGGNNWSIGKVTAVSTWTPYLTLDHSTGNATFSGAIAIGNTVNTVSPTSPNRTITMVIGGTTYYIHAKTTND